MIDGGAAFAAINTTFKFVDFCYKLRDVSKENQVFVSDAPERPNPARWSQR
jgi:hypothetical protein